MRTLVEVEFEFWENGAGLGNALVAWLALNGVRPLSRLTVIVSFALTAAVRKDTTRT
jgi:hypothetical protein